MAGRCPNRNELRLFLQGELRRSVSGEIEEHFANCDRCLVVAEQLDKQGALLGDLRLHFSAEDSSPTKEEIPSSEASPTKEEMPSSESSPTDQRQRPG